MNSAPWILKRLLELGLVSETNLETASAELRAAPAHGPSPQAQGLLDWMIAHGQVRPGTLQALGEECAKVASRGQEPQPSPFEPGLQPLTSDGQGPDPQDPLTLEFESGRSDFKAALKPGRREGRTPYPVPLWDRYEPLAFLGAGAMGKVFKVFDPQLQRVVALKFLFSLRQTIERPAGEQDERHFLREARTQARVDHPNVAKVFEIGEVDGLPYLAIQYLEGQGLGEAGQGLDLREKTELLEGVAQGLHAVHRLGVIHRDLKPSNILVTRGEDGRSHAVLTDFGLALSPELDEESLFGLITGTPAYMSPEQARGGLLDTRSDVYSLGATLYELLSGRLPTAPGPLMLARIQTEPPLPLRALAVVPRDLEAIVARCLEKVPAQRYDSALALAQDLRRFLEGRPVQALPATLRYRSRRWMGRNRSLAALAALLVATLGVAAGFMLWHWSKAQQTLQQEAETSRATSAFLAGLFKVSDPGEARGNTVTARELLDKGAEHIDSELKGQPRLQTSLMSTIGDVYYRLGLFQKARPLLEAAVRNQRQALGPGQPEVAVALKNLANLYVAQGAFAEAGPLFQESLQILERTLGADHPQVAETLNGLANLYVAQGRFAQAEPLFQRGIRIREKALGPDHPSMAISLGNLGALYLDQGRYDPAEPLLLRGLRIRERTLAADHPELARSLNDLAILYMNQGKLTAAEPLFLRSLAIREKTLGADHPTVADSLDNLANLYTLQGHLGGAEPLYLRSLAIRERSLGPNHPQLAKGLNNLGDFYQTRGQYAQAEQLLQRSLRIWEHSLLLDHPNGALVLFNLGCLRARQGRRAESLAFLRRALPGGATMAWMRAMGQDPGLVLLHGDPKFEALLAEVATAGPHAESSRPPGSR